MDNTILSIIVPVYQAETVIEQCVSAIVEERCADKIEVILIDDGSNDGSWEKCKIEAEKYSWVKIHRHDNHGVSYTRNRGIQYAKGEYIWFVDVDDIIVSGCLRKIMPIIERDKPDIVLFGYKSRLKRKKLNEFDTYPGIESGIRKRNEFLNEFWNMYSKNLIHNVGTKIYRREMILKNHILFADTISICEDALFCVEAIGAADYIYIFDDVFYCYNLECNKNSLNSGYRYNYLYAVDLLFDKITDVTEAGDYFANSYYLKSLTSVFFNEFRLKGHTYKRVIDLFKTLDKAKIEKKLRSIEFTKKEKTFWNNFMTNKYGACYLFLLKVHLKNRFLKSDFFNNCFDICYSIYKFIFNGKWMIWKK